MTVPAPRAAVTSAGPAANPLATRSATPAVDSMITGDRHRAFALVRTAAGRPSLPGRTRHPVYPHVHGADAGVSGTAPDTARAVITPCHRFLLAQALALPGHTAAGRRYCVRGAGPYGPTDHRVVKLIAGHGAGGERRGRRDAADAPGRFPGPAPDAGASSRTARPGTPRQGGHCGSVRRDVRDVSARNDRALSGVTLGDTGDHGERAHSRRSGVEAMRPPR